MVIRDGDVGTVRLHRLACGPYGTASCDRVRCPHPGPLPLRREREVGW